MKMNWTTQKIKNKNSLDPHKESKQDSYRDNRIFGIKCKMDFKKCKIIKNSNLM